MQTDYEKIKTNVVGRWRGVFSALGIDVPENPKQHGPCPICGAGNNGHRFRFDDRNGSGSWICSQCGSGDGWDLVTKHQNIDFISALRLVSGYVSTVPTKITTPAPDSDPKIALRKIASGCSKLTGADPVSKYLRSRKLMVETKDLLFCESCYESETKKKMSAMIGIVKNRQGVNVTLHRTYLDGTSKAGIASPKKIMPAACDSLSSCGAAIRLFDLSDVVGIAEGIETAISACQLFDIPTWAVISTSIMAGFEPPEGIRKIVIFADNDANFAGQKAAYALANKLFLKNYIVEVNIPDIVGDWNDVLIKQP